MKSPKYRITFKILAAYTILGVLATIGVILVLSEIKTFTQLQNQDSKDQNKILKVGGLIADIYENESLARAAIQLNSSRRFSEYVAKNRQLLSKIDSLQITTIQTESQEFILDSIKVIINRKLKNITDLKNLKRSYNSDEPISDVILKLSAVDSLLGKVSIDEFLTSLQYLDSKTRTQFQETTQILDNFKTQDSISKNDQYQIDSLLFISKNTLEKAQKQAINQRISLLKKERELISNDVIISRNLQELLNILEQGVFLYTKNSTKQREKTLQKSKHIILLATGIGFLTIIIFSIIILNDFWKSQRYRKQLEKANKTTSSLLKSREQIISMVSHDLRTPLSTITGYSELLQNSVQHTKDKNYVEHIGNASAYMGSLVDDLMEFSKLESGTTAIKNIPFNLKNLLDEISVDTKKYIKNKPVEFVTKHDNSIPESIVSDPFRIKQIVTNLVTNACKFTNEGSITLESNLLDLKDNNSLKISIRDTGIGVTKKQQKTIFNPFIQGESNQENRQHGFGLGLTISKKLAKLLKGSITLESEIDKGSRFTLTIPIATATKNKSNKVPSIFNLKAIVVEDDAAMRQLLKDILKQYHIDAVLFNNAQSALEAIDTIAYDLVLTDIQLPKMNGIQFMGILKKHDSYINQPIVAMTGRLNLSEEDYMNSGFSGILAKPFHALELQHILESFFRPQLLKTNIKAINDEIKEPSGFSIASLKTFLNNDGNTIKNTLKIFLAETKKNSILLKEAKKNNDSSAFNSISHSMLGMCKQLEIKSLTPFLESFETTKSIDTIVFANFEIALEKFLISLEKYLN